MKSSRLDQRVTNRNEPLRAKIEQEIIDGKFQPGQRLDEKALATRYGVSRTPVREALLQLSMTGWINLRPRRSAVVRVVSVRELISMWEVLTTLEGLCARLSARRMTVEERSHLKAVFESASAAAARQDARAYDAEDKRFHNAIYAGTRNEFLLKQAAHIRRRMHVHRRGLFQQPGRMERSVKEHLLILDAILAGDGQRADEHTQAHACPGGAEFFDGLVLMREQPGESSAPGQSLIGPP